MESMSLEGWRKYFDSGDCSIYQIIFNAIRVAALDNPEEFKLRRNKIVERLYSCQFTGHCCCVDQTEQDKIHSTITQVFQDCTKACAHETTKVVDDSAVGGGAVATADQQANELVNSIEDDENIRCVLQIKDELESYVLTENEIYESLWKLQSVVQSVGVMEATKIGSTISNLKSHKSKEISLLASNMADKWKAMIVEHVDKKAETAEKSTNPLPSVVLEEWREFPSVEFVAHPPVEFSEKKFLDDMDDFENAAGEDNNETGEERQKNASKENETEVKLMQESIKRERTKKGSVEKFINRRSNGPSNKSQVKVIEKTGATTEKNNSLGNKRKLEEDEEFITPMKRQKAVAPKQESSIHQKTSKAAPNPTLPKTEYPSDGDQKPRTKKEAQKDSSETRGRYRALRINAEPGHASSPVRESRRSSDSIAAEERLETSKKKLQAGYQAHERAKRNIQLIPEGRVQKNASTGRSSKNQTRK